MQYTNAREYLSKLMPWSQPGEPTAYINIHYSFKSDHPVYAVNGKQWRGSACETLDDAVRQVAYIMGRPDTLDIYACQSSQAVREERIGRNQRPYYIAKRSAEFATQMKSLFLDADIKDHGDEETLIAHLSEFIKATNLPKPSFVVHTGGGLHTYWVFNRNLTIAEWEPLAAGLAEATKQHNFKCDTQCTIDAARILRIPDTFNRKTEPHRPVKLASRNGAEYGYDTLKTLLDPYTQQSNFRARTHFDASLIAAFPPRTPVLDDGLSAGIEIQKFDPIDLDEVLPNCAFLADAVATGGRAHDNPLWNLTTLVSTFLVDGRVRSHQMSSGHADYTVEKQDEMFDRKDGERQSRQLGWPSCATISGTGCRLCAGCPNFNQGKSPLHFRTQPSILGNTAGVGSPTPAPQQAAPTIVQTGFGPAAAASAAHMQATTNTIPQAVQTAGQDLPPRYVRDANGVVSALVVDEEGKTEKVPVSPYPMTTPWLQKDPRILHFNSIVDRGQVTQIDIELEHIGTNEMRKILQAQGFMLSSKANIASEFFVSWIKKLQETAEAVSSAPFGWHHKNGKIEGFVYGNQLWSPSAPRPSASADSVIARQYTPKGEMKHWLDAVKLVTSQGRPDLEAIVASAFAAPLVTFTGQPGVLMSAYSQESGIGKTTALRIAQAVWGDPVKAVQSLSDTQNAVMGKIGEIRSLPLYWDELKTEEDTRKFVNITFQITQGKEKSRMTASARQREPGSWQTLIVSASNDSLLNYVTEHTSTTTAGLYRVFEYTVQPPNPNTPGMIEPSNAAILLSKLNNNFGHVGLEYAKFLGKYHKRIENDMSTFLDVLGKEVQTTQDERFWMALMAAVLLGAKYADALGLAKFDHVGLKSFMLKTLDTMRGERKSQPIDMAKDINISTILGRFLSAHRQKHTLETNRIHIARGKPQAGSIKVLNPDPSRLEGIYVHIGREDKIMRVSSQALTEWLAVKKISRHIFRSAMEKEFGMKTVHGRIGGGTQFAGVTEYLLEINLAGTTVLNFIDEA